MARPLRSEFSGPPYDMTAQVLIDNHVPLVVETPAANLAKAMCSSTLSQPFDLRPCANHIQRNVVTYRAIWSTAA